MMRVVSIGGDEVQGEGRSQSEVEIGTRLLGRKLIPETRRSITKRVISYCKEMKMDKRG